MSIGTLFVEAHRNLLRPATLAIVAGYLALAVAWATLFSDIVGYQGYLKYTYLVFPLLLLPLSARTITRDHEEDFAAVLAVTPISTLQALAAKIWFLILTLIMLVLFAAPLTMMLALPAGAEAQSLALRFLEWGIVTGASAIVTGTVIGQVAGRRNTLAVSASFILAIVWVVVPENLVLILTIAKSQATFDLLFALLHLSPLTWAYHDLSLLGGVQVSHVTASPLLGAGAAVLVPTLLVLVITYRSQFVGAWRSESSKRAALLSPLLIAVIVVGTISAQADYRTYAPELSSDSPKYRGPAFEVWPQIEFNHGGNSGSSGAYIPGRPNHANLTLFFENADAAHIVVDEIGISSTHFVVDLIPDTPIRAGVGDSGDTFIRLPLKMSVRYFPNLEPAGAPANLRVVMTVNNESVVLQSTFHVEGPGIPYGQVVSYTSVAVAAPLFGAWVIPRRLNRW